MNRSEVLKKQIQYYAYAISAVIFLSLGKLIGNTGLTYIAIGMETVSFFMVFCSDYMSETLTKMIKYRRKRNQFKDVIAIRKRIFIFELFAGIILVGLSYIFADSITEKIFHLSRASLLIKILSPILILRILGCYFASYIQSFGKYLHIGLLFLIKQLFFWLFATGITKNKVDYGQRVAKLLQNEEYVGMYGATGVAIALLLSEVFIFLALAIYYLFANREHDKANSDRTMQRTESAFATYREFILSNGNGFYFSLLKQILILLPIILITDTQIRGLWYGKYCMIISIPIYIVLARLTYFTHGLTGIIRNRDMRMSREYIQTGIKYTWSFGLLVSLLLAVLAPQFVGAYFPDDVKLTKCLQYGSVLILLIIMIIYFVMVHIAHHRKLECFIILAITAALFFIINRSMYSKTPSPVSLIYASFISLFIGMLVLGALTIFQYGVNTDYVCVFVLPLICVGLTCLIVLMVEKAMNPHVGNQIGVIVGAVLGTVLYIGSLSFCRIFDETDINRLFGPIGKKLLSFLFR